MKQILKFDTGADGFKTMVYVSSFFAALVLILGVVFIIKNFT